MKYEFKYGLSDYQIQMKINKAKLSIERKLDLMEKACKLVILFKSYRRNELLFLQKNIGGYIGNNELLFNKSERIILNTPKQFERFYIKINPN